jgi:hypothetical protein
MTTLANCTLDKLKAVNDSIWKSIVKQIVIIKFRRNKSVGKKNYRISIKRRAIT